MVNVKYIAMLRRQTGNTVSMKDCKEALKQSNGDIDDALRVLEEIGLIETKKEGRFAPHCPDSPPTFAYIRQKAFSFLKSIRGRIESDHIESLYIDSFNEVQSGFEQLVACKGYKPDSPLEGVGIEGFYEMMDILGLEVVQQHASFREDFILDEMVVENIMGMRTSLFNRVRRPA